jgi:hypothetical protein
MGDMSIKVMSAVWENSKQHQGSLLVLLAIADYAHEDGSGAYPAIETLARKSRLSLRQTRRAIQTLVQAGELVVEHNKGPNRVNLYRVTFCQGDILTPCQNFRGEGDILSPQTPDKMSPKPSREPLEGSSVISSSAEASEDIVIPRKRGNPLIKTTMDTLESIREFPSGNYAAEARAVKLMLDQGYVPDDILLCYQDMKKDKFWTAKALMMNSVAKQIGEWKKASVPTEDKYTRDYEKRWGENG